MTIEDNIKAGKAALTVYKKGEKNVNFNKRDR